MSDSVQASRALALTNDDTLRVLRRWHNQLNPSIKKDSWTAEEDRVIIELQAKFGNAWAKIAHRLDGRTDNAVKNRWHSSLLKSSTRRSTRKKRSQPASSSGGGGGGGSRPRKALKTKRQSRATGNDASGGVASPDAVDAESLGLPVPVSPEIKLECDERPSWEESASIEASDEFQLMKLLTSDDDDDDASGSYESFLISSECGLEAFERRDSSSAFASRGVIGSGEFAIDDDTLRPSTAGDALDLAPLASTIVATPSFPFFKHELLLTHHERALNRVENDDEASRALYHSVWKGTSSLEDPAAAAPLLALAPADALYSNDYSFPMPPASHEDATAAAGFLYLSGDDILL